MRQPNSFELKSNHINKPGVRAVPKVCLSVLLFVHPPVISCRYREVSHVDFESRLQQHQPDRAPRSALALSYNCYACLDHVQRHVSVGAGLHPRREPDREDLFAGKRRNHPIPGSVQRRCSGYHASRYGHGALRGFRKQSQQHERPAHSGTLTDGWQSCDPDSRVRLERLFLLQPGNNHGLTGFTNANPNAYTDRNANSYTDSNANSYTASNAYTNADASSFSHTLGNHCGESRHLHASGKPQFRHVFRNAEPLSPRPGMERG